LELVTPKEKIVDERMIKTHNKLRLNKDAIRKTLDYHHDYHYKPVWDGTEENLKKLKILELKWIFQKIKHL
jgi:hypothetical protein